MLNLQEYAGLLIFLAIGLGFIIPVFLVSAFFRERGSDPLRKSTYECGMKTIGSPYVSPNIRFYRFALVFVIFDVEAVFIFPWAVKFKALGWLGFWEMAIFLAILMAGFAYAWRKDALKWE